LRSFIAIDVNDEIRTALARMQQTLARGPVKVKWTAPENIHLTMKFLGEVADAQTDALTAAMAAAVANAGPIIYKVEGLGTFPVRGAPRVVWAGVSQGSAGISRLQAGLEKQLGPLGFEPEKRFVPHVTLGRVKSPKGARGLTDVIKQQGAVAFGTCRAEELVLYRSKLMPQGAVYSVVAKQTLV
jgi:RNA 2',3'-cyclic 3'-phosphodiesterase